MKRADMQKIIKLRSVWKVDKRRGNYRLPSGDLLSNYLFNLLDTQLKIDNLGIAKDGSIQFLWEIKGDLNKQIIMVPFGENEETNWGEQYNRMDKLIREMIY